MITKMYVVERKGFSLIFLPRWVSFFLSSFPFSYSPLLAPRSPSYHPRHDRICCNHPPLKIHFALFTFQPPSQKFTGGFSLRVAPYAHKVLRVFEVGFGWEECGWRNWRRRQEQLNWHIRS
jgi:hypothetical protein